MKKIKIHFLHCLFIFCLTIMVSCNNTPDFSNSPVIELKSLRFQAKTDTSTRDSLNIEISFLDGNGDLGLSSSDIAKPYHALDTLKEIGGRYIFFDIKNNVYNRDNWLIVTSLPVSKQNPRKRYQPNTGVHYDTIRVERNYVGHYNFFVIPHYNNENDEFLLVKDKNVNGIQAIYTDQFYSRFPVLNTTGEERPLRGTLKGKFGGIYSENPVLSKEILKFEIYIKDKELNESNHVFSEPLQFGIR